MLGVGKMGEGMVEEYSLIIMDISGLEIGKIIKDGSGQASNSVDELTAHVYANSSPFAQARRYSPSGSTAPITLSTIVGTS